MRKVFTLARYLRVEGRYSNGALPGESQYEAGHDLRRLTKGFLLAPRAVGDDEQYAAAMALLANRVGVPARVVVGAVVPADGKVRGKDVHAWVELRIADGTWRTLPTEEFMGDQPPRRSMTAAPRPRSPRYAVAPTPPTAPEVQQLKDLRDKARAEQRGTAVRWVPWLVLLLLALVVPTAKQTRRGVRRRRGRPSDQVAGAWSELVDHARDLGVPVLVGATRPAQARMISRGEVLAQRADDRVFAASEPVGQGGRRGLEAGACGAARSSVDPGVFSAGCGRPSTRSASCAGGEPASHSRRASRRRRFRRHRGRERDPDRGTPDRY